MRPGQQGGDLGELPGGGLAPQASAMLVVPGPEQPRGFFQVLDLARSGLARRQDCRAGTIGHVIPASDRRHEGGGGGCRPGGHIRQVGPGHVGHVGHHGGLPAR